MNDRTKYIPSGMVEVQVPALGGLRYNPCPFCGNKIGTQGVFADMKSCVGEKSKRAFAAVVHCSCGASGRVIERPKTRDGAFDGKMSDEQLYVSAIRNGWNLYRG